MKLKTIICLFISFLGMLPQVDAQSEIMLRINHLVQGEILNSQSVAENNMVHPFNIRRIEYYISGVEMIHDDGIVTSVDDLYILVNGFQTTKISLGNHSIDNLEALQFKIGVEESLNHEDPTLWDEDHALSPKDPSMHWGWAGGYRFVALEGFSGTGLANEFQLHGLGDDNYFTTSIETDFVELNGMKIIDIDANYEESLRDIDVSAGVISHGSTDHAKQCLENFRDFVFSPASGVSSTKEEISSIGLLKLYPNPSNVKDDINVQWTTNQKGSSTLVIYNANGVQIQKYIIPNNQQQQQIKLENPGLYIGVLTFQNGLNVKSKIVVQ